MRRSDGEVIPATTGRSFRGGRSAYVCPCRACFVNAIDRRGFERSLGRDVRVLVRADTLWSRFDRDLTRELAVLVRTSRPGARRRSSTTTLLSHIRESARDSERGG